MNGLHAALWAEGLKVRRSKMFLGTVIVFCFIAVMLGLLMFLARHPELAGRTAVARTKTSAMGNSDWPSFFSLLVQCILALGAMGFGIVTSWVFGREFSDRTAKDLLALPVSRSMVVASKFIITVLWNVLLSAILFIASILTGFAVHIPGWSAHGAVHASFIFALGAVMTILLCAPVAFVAGLGRGYLLPIGFVILTMIFTQLVGVGIPGLAPYFPWAVPALCSGVAASSALQPCAAGCVIYIVTILAGFLGTVLWWRFADQT